MSWQEWILFGMFWVWFALALLLHAWASRNRREVTALLAEVQRCNDEFAESIELLRYGAFDEAVEVAGRSAKRRKADRINQA